ncbi:AMP-binding protein [Alcaligenaceae bacterium]|nr:AMP-binding protein [Alcaligenaceae bacterium]
MPLSLSPREVLALYPSHNGTLSSLLETRVLAARDRPFVVFRGSSYSYGQVWELVNRAAAMYAARGIGAGDRVGVMSRNHITTVATFLALSRLGATMCPFNPDFREEEASYVIGHSELGGILCSPACLPIVHKALAQSGRGTWILLNEAGDAASSEQTWDAAMAEAPSGELPDAATPESTCVFIYTSGTTGLPKAVMHAQRSVVLAGEGFVGRMHLQPHDRLLCILPAFHANALFYSICGALAAGATVILQEGFSASTFWDTVKETGATEVNFIAAIPGILAKRPRDEFVPGHRLEKICVGPLSQETEKLFTETFGVPDLLDGYGMSEVPGVCITPLRGERRLGSVGKLCRHPDPDLKFAELRVVDEAGNDLPAGQVGEFLVRTPTVMQGYFRDPEQTQAAFRDGEWFITGDLGYRDADDFIWFVGRKKDIIRKRGENISGAELDRVVGNHPAVQEAAAIAVPAELGEDEILVVVVPRPGHQVSARDIADWCAARLARIKVPRFIVFVDHLPHTATHRVEKHKLKKDPSLLTRAIDLQESARG